MKKFDGRLSIDLVGLSREQIKNFWDVFTSEKDDATVTVKVGDFSVDGELNDVYFSRCEDFLDFEQESLEDICCEINSANEEKSEDVTEKDESEEKSEDAAEKDELEEKSEDAAEKDESEEKSEDAAEKDESEEKSEDAAEKDESEEESEDEVDEDESEEESEDEVYEDESEEESEDEVYEDESEEESEDEVDEDESEEEFEDEAADDESEEEFEDEADELEPEDKLTEEAEEAEEAEEDKVEEIIDVRESANELSKKLFSNSEFSVAVSDVVGKSDSSIEERAINVADLLYEKNNCRLKHTINNQIISSAVKCKVRTWESIDELLSDEAKVVGMMKADHSDIQKFVRIVDLYVEKGGKKKGFLGFGKRKSDVESKTAALDFLIVLQDIVLDDGEKKSVYSI